MQNLVKLASAIFQKIRKKREEERESNNRKFLFLPFGGLFFLIIVCLTPMLIVTSVFGGNNDVEEITETTIYSQVSKVLENKIEEWEEYGGGSYPDEAHALAYLCIINKKENIKKWNYKKSEIKKFYDKTVSLKDKKVTVKELRDIAGEVFPGNEEYQKLFETYYLYFSQKLEEEISGSNTGVNTTEVKGKLEDAEVTTYNTGMAIPHYYQYDNAWGGKSYGSSTVASAGCGPTSAAMVLSYFTKLYITPDVLCQFSQSNGYHVSAGTSWSFFDAVAKEYGVNCKDLGKDYTQVTAELAQNHPVIASMGPGTFTKAGHFIVLRGLDSKGNILVNDPNDSSSKKFYKMSFPINQINNEAKNYWSFFQ